MLYYVITFCADSMEIGTYSMLTCLLLAGSQISSRAKPEVLSEKCKLSSLHNMLFSNILY